MASETNSYDLPRTMVRTIRAADVLTGEFLRPVPEDSLTELRRLGLALSDQPALSRSGLAIRSWLMRGAPSAPQQIAALLRGTTVRPAADEAEDWRSPRLTGPDMAFSGATAAANRRPV